MPNIKEVFDRPLPTKIDSAQLESQRRGAEGIGLNEKSFNELLADLNQGGLAGLNDER